MKSIRTDRSTYNLQPSTFNLKWDDRGLIPAVVQDATTHQVLMVAWMNAEALRLTLATGETHFWSRSRGDLWHKGATSGNTQRVISIWADCDGDTLLVQVAPAGPACHTGAVSCFYRHLVPAPSTSATPESSLCAALFEDQAINRTDNRTG